MSVFLPVSTILFDYCSFVIHLKVRKCEDSSFILLSQDYFSYLGSFVISYEFYDFLHFYKKLSSAFQYKLYGVYKLLRVVWKF